MGSAALGEALLARWDLRLEGGQGRGLPGKGTALQRP